MHGMDTDIQIVTGHHMSCSAMMSPLRRKISPSFRPSQFRRENRHGQYRFDHEQHE
jgi:hypothetical protein